MEIAIRVGEAVVPEQNAVRPWDLLDPFEDELHYIGKMTTKSDLVCGTYLLPVLTCLGLTSARLK